MVKCPICKKEINELDEICPHCKTNFNKLDGIKQESEDEHIKKNIEDVNIKLNEKEQTNKRTNADNLHTMACVIFFLSIVGAVVICGTYMEIGISFVGILIGITVLMAGAAIYYMFETLVDVYRKIDNK